MSKFFLLSIILLSSLAFGQGAATKTIGNQPMQNYVINGGMDFAQRIGTTATNLTASPVYYLDRWSSQYGGTFSGTPTVTWHDLTAAQFAGGVTRYAMKFAGNATNSTAEFYADQKIESSNARVFSRVSGTLSFWVYSESATLVEVTPYYPNTIDTYGAMTLAGTSTQASVSVNTWTKITAPISANSGFTKGLRFYIALKNMSVTGSVKNHYITQVMLNEGATAAPFRLAGGDIQGETAKIQYYHNRIFINASLGYPFGMCFGVSTTGANCFIPMPKMRGLPSVSWSAPGGAINIRRTGFQTGVNVAGATIGVNNHYGNTLIFALSNLSGVTVNEVYELWGADAYINVDAEL